MHHHVEGPLTRRFTLISRSTFVFLHLRNLIFIYYMVYTNIW